MQIIGNDIYHEGWKVGRVDPEPNAPATVVESFIGWRRYHPAYHYDRAEKKPAPPPKRRGRR
jgi:hypothetical protein